MRLSYICVVTVGDFKVRKCRVFSSLHFTFKITTNGTGNALQQLLPAAYMVYHLLLVLHILMHPGCVLNNNHLPMPVSYMAGLYWLLLYTLAYPVRILFLMCSMRLMRQLLLFSLLVFWLRPAMCRFLY